MIVGIGIDMIEVDRVREKIDRNAAFREAVFSADEIAWCERQTNKAENYAARFAAKEAFLKATGRGLALGYELANIEIINDSWGRPLMRLAGVYLEEASKSNWNRIHVSLSHLKQTACAVVIIEQ
ncbi:MAG TPA: holo-ACP synthase [Chryseolinea sp.]|nr:holo-ACP synthase [Chryseolinea sp.]